MTNAQLYWIIGAIIVLIAIALLITLMSRRGRGDDVVEMRHEEPVRPAAARPEATATTVRPAGDEQSRTRLSSLDATAAPADDTATAPKADGAGASALRAFDATAIGEKGAGTSAPAPSASLKPAPSFGSTSSPAPVEAAETAPAPQAVDPLAAAVEALPDQTPAEIAAEALEDAAPAAETTAVTKPAAAAPATVALPVTDRTDSASSTSEGTLGLGAAGGDAGGGRRLQGG